MKWLFKCSTPHTHIHTLIKFYHIIINKKNQVYSFTVTLKSI